MANLVTCDNLGDALAAWLAFSEDNAGRYRLFQRLTLREPVPYTAGVPVSDPLYAVTYLGNVFAPLPQALPFDTGAIFEPTWWRYVGPRQPRTAAVSFDPGPLPVGQASSVQTTTVAGAEIGAYARGAIGINPQGLQVNAWVSAANTVSWYIVNPAGNPAGPVDLFTTDLILTVS